MNEKKKPSTVLLRPPKHLSDLNANTCIGRVTHAQSSLYDTASQDKQQDGLFMGFGFNMFAVRNNSVNTQGLMVINKPEWIKIAKAHIPAQTGH